MRAFGCPAHRLAFTHALIDDMTHPGLGRRTGDPKTIAVATGGTLDPNLRPHNIPLYLFQNIFTLLKGESDLLGCDSTGTSIEFCDFFHG
jgi:hypothetical protein